jgi:hypothetical protein
LLIFFLLHLSCVISVFCSSVLSSDSEYLFVDIRNGKTSYVVADYYFATLKLHGLEHPRSRRRMIASTT